MTGKEDLLKSHVFLQAFPDRRRKTSDSFSHTFGPICLETYETKYVYILYYSMYLCSNIAEAGDFPALRSYDKYAAVDCLRVMFLDCFSLILFANFFGKNVSFLTEFFNFQY